MGSCTLFFISGNSLLVGLLLIISGAIFSFFDFKWFFKIASRIFIITGILLFLAAGSSVSILNTFGLVVFSTALIFIRKEKTTKDFPIGHILRITILLSCLYLFLIEFLYWSLPVVDPDIKYEKMYVIGDSLSAGIGFSEEKTWIDVLKEDKGVDIIALVQGGAILEHAVEKADKVKGENVLILLEIGGNDILRETDLKSFRKNMEDLLQKLSGKNRTIVMFELPLPPFKGEFGRVQRQMAKKYGVLLIPRRYLAYNLSKENTYDGLHFSNPGHKRISEIVWTVIEPGFR